MRSYVKSAFIITQSHAHGFRPCLHGAEPVHMASANMRKERAKRADSEGWRELQGTECRSKMRDNKQGDYTGRAYGARQPEEEANEVSGFRMFVGDCEARSAEAIVVITHSVNPSTVRLYSTLMRTAGEADSTT